MALCLGKFEKKKKPAKLAAFAGSGVHAWTAPAALFLGQNPSVATPRYNNLATFDTNARQNSYALDYAFNKPIVPNYLVDQSFYSGARELNSFVPFDGDIAPNYVPTVHNVSSLAADYVSDDGPWAPLNPDFSNPAPSVSSPPAAYVSDDGPWASLSPDFSTATLLSRLWITASGLFPIAITVQIVLTQLIATRLIRLGTWRVWQRPRSLFVTMAPISRLPAPIPADSVS